jgi:hypothetical protein
MQQLPPCSGSASRTPVLRSWSSWSLVWSFISPEWVLSSLRRLGTLELSRIFFFVTNRLSGKLSHLRLASLSRWTLHTPCMWILLWRPLGVELLSPSPSSPSSLILNGLPASWLGGGDCHGDFDGPSTLTFESKVSNPLARVARHLCL